MHVIHPHSLACTLFTALQLTLPAITFMLGNNLERVSLKVACIVDKTGQIRKDSGSFDFKH